MLNCTNENKGKVVEALIGKFDFKDLTVSEVGAVDSEDPLNHIVRIHAHNEDGKTENLSFHVRFTKEGSPIAVYAYLLSNGGEYGSLPDWVIQHVVVFAIGAYGSPDFELYSLILNSEEEYDLGKHYNKAKELAENDEYERPMLTFDKYELSPITMAAERIKSLSM